MKYTLIAATVLVIIDFIVRIKNSNIELIRNKLHMSKDSKIIKLLTPKVESKNYEKQKKLIQKSRLNISVEGYQMVMLSTFLITLIITTAIFITQYKVKTESAFNKKSININLIGSQKESENDAYLNKLTKEAHEKIKYKELFEGGDYEEVQKQIYSLIENQGIDKGLALEYSEKVYKNLINLYKNKFSYKHILFIVLISISSLLLPNTFLRIRAKRTESLIDEELNKLEILTLLLLKKEDVNIYQILLKLHSKAEILRPYFKKCINDYQRDGRKAMEVMQEEVEHKPFTDFVNILKQGIDANKKTTFNTLEITRRLRNEILVSMTKDKIEKRNRNILLVRFPMLLAGIYLLVLPWIIIFKENL